MPIYEYQCPKHGIFEEISNIDMTNKKCPVCKVRCYKVVSLPSPAHFKGTGFYETDYKKKVGANWDMWDKYADTGELQKKRGVK